MPKYLIPAGTTVQVKPVSNGQWTAQVTAADAHHDEYIPTTDGRYWVFIRDGLATRVEPHRVGREAKPKAVRAAKLAAAKAKAEKDAKARREQERQRLEAQAAVIRAARSATTARAGQIEAETRGRVERARAARAAELAAADAEWAKLVGSPGHAEG